MNKTKISIIATFYNLEDYAKRCVDSLTSQTLQDIEIICVNDGSQDNTINILQELAQNDNRIKIIDKKNEGVSIARNTGINAASGEYIMFVDGDDYLEPNACEILYKKAIDTNVDIIVFQTNYIKLKSKEPSIYFKNSKYYIEINNIPYIFSDNSVKILQSIQSRACWDKIYKNKFIKSNKIFFPENLTHCEDAVFMLKIFLANPKTLITDYNFYNYFISRETSLTKIDKYKYLQKFLTYLNYINDILINNNNTKNNIITLFFVDYTLLAILSLGKSLCFSKHKKEYISSIEQILDIYKDFDKKTVEKMNGYKRAKKYLLMDKYHLLGIYLSIIRPVGKYCLVLPYRLIKKLFKS